MKKRKDPDNPPTEPADEAPQSPEQDDRGEAPAETFEGLQVQRDELMARLQRVSADYLNYQKRTQRDLAQAREFANESLIKSLLPILDDVERALAAGRDNHGQDDPLLLGMQMVHDKALETLSRFGLRVIEAQGREFDPDRHTAMMQQPSAEHAPNTVVQEIQRGYELKGRAIRPAAVIVSKSPEQEPRDPEQPQPEDSPRE